MTTSNSPDAFRLGCYAAAKHAGASHDEAIAFVADLDRQALQQDAFRLGAFKTAKDHGASDEQALEFVGTVEKRAAGQMIGKGIAGLRKLLSPTAVGKATSGFVGNVGKGMAAPGKKAPLRGAAHWMRKNPGKTGLGVMAGGAYAAPKVLDGAKSVLGIGGDKAQEGPGGGGLSQRDRMLMMMLSRQGHGGQDNPWLHAGAMPYYQ